MERLVLVALLGLSGGVTGCPESTPPPQQPSPQPSESAAPQTDPSWIKSEKLDTDLQELLLRAYEVDLAFPLRVRVRCDDGGIEETIERLRPSDVAGLVRDVRVVAVRCAPPPTSQIADDEWRAKVDPDVRMIHGAQSACWTAIALRFEHEPSDDEWRGAEDAGVVVHARDARSALVWAPVRAIPRIAALSFVAKVEPFDRDPEY